MLLWLVSSGAAAVPSGDCVDLTDLDEAALAKYSFNAGAEARALAELRQPSYITGDVRIVVQAIFDTDSPGQDHWLYQQANRWHRPTRDSVIRHAVLFRTGVVVNVAMLRESERILRANSYLYDARVIPRRLCGDRLDIDVVVRDVWTLTPTADFSRLGGKNEYGFGVLDTNLLGKGRALSLDFSKDTDRRSAGISYVEPNIAGSRIGLSTLLEDNSDGSRQVIDVGQPFYSLDARRAYGVRAEHDDRQQGLYLFGDKTSEFQATLKQIGFTAGVSGGAHDAHTLRWLAGFNYEDHAFDQVSDAVPPNPFPVDRTLAYPWVGFESIEDRFDTTANVDRIDRTEDLQLGREFSALLGWSDAAFGGDDVPRLVWRGRYHNATYLRERQLLQYDFDLNSYWNFDTDAVEELRAAAQLDYRWMQSNRFTLAATLKTRYAANLPADQQLLGGAETGMRGYSSRYQAGDRSYYFGLEERYFSDLYIAQIVRVGFVVFTDVGRTWFSDDPNDAGYGTLADVGFGFRFDSTRTRRDRVVHLDFAFPLIDGPDVGSFEILLQVKDRI